MNLTDQQKDLLRLLVSKHESNGGAQFTFNHSINANGLSYAPDHSVQIVYDYADFRRLRNERLITLIPVAGNQQRGKPTELGIAMVRCGFCPQRVMREFEIRCPLLASSQQEWLNQSGEQREHVLSREIDIAAAHLRERRAAIDKMTGDDERDAAENSLRREIAAFRQKIVELATTVVREGIREFSDALLRSQGKLGSRGVLVREYTAQFASEIRNKLNLSQVFQIEPLPAWQQDTITQEAIQTCEQVIAERTQIESGGLPPNGVEEDRASLNSQNEKGSTWPRVVQEWEASKSIRKLFWSSDGERIPEADLRRILADLNGIKPEDVTEGQIEPAAMELVHRYSRLRVVPAASTEVVPAAAKAQQLNNCRDGAFWRDREDEFRRNDVIQNALLGATWYSWGSYWSFHAGSSSSAPADSVDLFKSLAREAARGLSSPRGSESWMDWLDILRCAKDEDTGELLFAKDSSGSCTISERDLSDLTKSGETIPAGGLIEFVGTADGGIERQTYWDTSTTAIENLFKNSANYCSKLRSLAPSPIPTAPNGEPKAEFQAHSWEEVGISFFNEFSVEITVGPTKVIHEFGRLRMANKRSGNPSLAWQTLHHLAISNGVISAPVGKKPNWGKVEKRMQELRAWLRSLFGLRSDPLPFVKGTGYRAEFEIKCAPSYKR